MVTDISVSLNAHHRRLYDPAVSRFRASAAALSVLLGALMGWGSLVWVAAPAHADRPLRVLLTGDSITHGRNGDYTWRYRLYKEFRRQGVPVDFVGSKSAPYVDHGYSSARYADPNFDQDHFALFGWELREMVPRIGPEVRAQQPDVIVLEAGVNDIRHHRNEPGIVSSTEAALRAWIANVRTAKADTRIVLSPVLSVDSAAGPVINPMIHQYDADLTGIAAQLSTPESPITVAATTQGWNPSGDLTWDGLHPSSTGETFIAQRVAEALRRVGLLPELPQVYRKVVWPRTERPIVHVSGTRLTVSWNRQAIGAGRVLLKRAGGPGIAARAFYKRGRQVLSLARGTTYDVRVQVRRGKMVGRWGPAVRVRAVAQARPVAPSRVTINSSGVHWTAAVRARSYVVQFHRAHQQRWTTRRTTRLRVFAKHLTGARVRAVGPGGNSGWRQATR